MQDLGQIIENIISILYNSAIGAMNFIFASQNLLDWGIGFTYTVAAGIVLYLRINNRIDSKLRKIEENREKSLALSKLNSEFIGVENQAVQYLKTFSEIWINKQAIGVMNMFDADEMMSLSIEHLILSRSLTRYVQHLVILAESDDATLKNLRDIDKLLSDTTKDIHKDDLDLKDLSDIADKIKEIYIKIADFGDNIHKIKISWINDK